MSLTATPVYPQTPSSWPAALVNATGAFTFAAASNTVTNLVSLVAGGTNGVKVEAINVTSTDTVTQTLYLILNNGTYNFILGTFLVPIAAGTNAAAPALSLFGSTLLAGLSYDSAGNKYLNVAAGSTLYVGTAVVVTAAKQVSVVAFGAAF